ncbi:MAG TPA: SRPBCC family protein [Streptosporangiaceae bacterium]
MMDIVEQVNAVRRKVGTRMLEAGEARSVTISQTYDTDVDDLWEACTDPARISRWFLPVTGELRLGGRYQLEGNAGGTIERCDPPKSFSATWEFGGGMSWIEVRLAPDPDGGTRLELEHIAHADEHWGEFGPGAVGIGWDGAFLGLARYLATGLANDPREAAAWMASAEGKEFFALSGDRWRDADIAGGADPAAAHAAAERTKAAYTAPPPDSCPSPDDGHADPGSASAPGS